MNLCDLPAHRLAELLARQEISAEELTAAYVERITQVDPLLQAYVTATPDLALAQARAVDQRRRAGEELPAWAGIPMALKDNIVTRGIPTTASSRILRDYVPPYSATVAERLLATGAVLLGKTNLDEFAMGSTTENSGLFPTHNPFDLARVPGGSSGGSAAAVAAREAVYALGSDTGGSIREPAAFCGVVGLKPTYGRVSRYGLIAFGSSLDQIGPLTRDVRDAALVLEAIAGADPRDATSADVPVARWSEEAGRSVAGLSFALPAEFQARLDAPLADALASAREALLAAGMREVEVALPSVAKALSAYYILAPAEASSNLARYDGIRYGLAAFEADEARERMRRSRGQGFGREVKRRIVLGTFVLSAGYVDRYYKRALALREALRGEFAQAFAQADVLLTPTVPTLPFPHGAVQDPLAVYQLDVCTIPANLAGLPALSLPAGTESGLPLAVQLMAPWFEEGRLVRVGAVLEEALPRVPLPGEEGFGLGV